MKFNNHRAYQIFAQKIRRTDRFGLDPACQDFLKIFRANIQSRKEVLKKGTILVRAVRDYVEGYSDNGSIMITGAGEERVLPKREFAFEGRVNPSGTLVLYLASSPETAVSEIRPWKGELVSIAQFSILRDLKIANLSLGHDKNSFFELTLDEKIDKSKISLEKANRCVWNDIDSAFSRPTIRTDVGAEYTPTQLLSEVVKNEGFDGVFYKSAFGGKKGYNIALYNISDAEIVACNAFGIDDITVSFSQAGNAWTRTK